MEPHRKIRFFEHVLSQDGQHIIRVPQSADPYSNTYTYRLEKRTVEGILKIELMYIMYLLNNFNL